MDNIIPTKRLHYAKIYGEGRLLHDLKNNALDIVKTWNHKGRCAPFSSSVLFSEVAVIKFRKIPLEIPAMVFCFSSRAWDFISTEIQLCSMLHLEFWRSYFSEYLRLIVVPKSSQQNCSIKKLFLKNSQYSQETTCIGICF